MILGFYVSTIIELTNMLVYLEYLYKICIYEVLSHTGTNYYFRMIFIIYDQ